MPPQYKRYHSSLKTTLAEGKISHNVQSSIPRSTRQRWKHLSKNSFLWPEDNMNTSLSGYRKINTLLRFLCYVTRIQQRVLQHFHIKEQHFRQAAGYVHKAIQYAGKEHAHIPWKYLPFSAHQWAAWNSRKICARSLLLLCRKKHPAQLDITEVKAIREQCSLPGFRHWPLASIYYQLLRDNKINCSISTFYKYCRLKGISKKPIRKPKSYTPVFASAPLKTLHMDVTLFRTANSVKHYLYLIRDNYSRAILACNVTTEYSSNMAKETLQQVLQRFGLMNKEGTLITDNGSENKGALAQWLNKPGILWKKLIAQVDIIQSNSMAEAANKNIQVPIPLSSPYTRYTDTQRHRKKSH